MATPKTKTPPPKSTAKAPPAPARGTSKGNPASASTAGASGTGSPVNIQPQLVSGKDAPAPTQRFGTVTQRLPVALFADVRQQSVANLNQVLADTITLRDMYKKHHWQVVGPTFYQLHLLYDKHFEEQATLVDTIAERIQILGGVAVAMAHDIAEQTSIPRVPRDREEAPVQVSRLLDAHERILKNCHDFAAKADDAGDDGTNDLLISEVLRQNELQVWFISEHLVDSPLIQPK